MSIRSVLCILTAVVLAACSYPRSDVTSGGEKPTLAVQGLSVSSEAELIVDGLSYGMAAKYDGKDEALVLDPGVHTVEIVDRGQVIFSQKVLLTTGTMRVVDVN